MFHPEDMMQVVVIRRLPNIQFDSCESTNSWWDESEGKFDPSTLGPLYRVMMDAPIIATMVPTDFAWLLAFLISNFSILNNAKDTNEQTTSNNWNLWSNIVPLLR